MVSSAQKIETDENNKIETCQGRWSELQTDLLKEIAGRLYFSDYFRFYGVCKNWLATKSYPTPAAYFLPWLVKIPFSTNKSLACQLYEPFSRNPKPTLVFEIPLHQFLVDDQTCDSVDIDIRYKYGWLFLSISNKDCSDYTNFTLFSILTRNVITLPTLHHSKARRFALVYSFSSDPNSPECVFVVMQCTCTNQNTISTLRRGDKDWTTKTLCRRYYGFVGNDALCIRGIFYFVSYGGQVASYDISRGVWREERESDDTVLNHDDLFRKQEVFLLEGDLVRICIGKHYFNRKNHLCFIRKFDMSEKVWVPLKTLRCDRALFVSRNSFCISTIGEEAKKNGVQANNVYGLICEGRTLHSLDNGKLINSTNGLEINKWVTDEDFGKLSFWFEPLHHLVRLNQ